MADENNTDIRGGAGVPAEGDTPDVGAAAGVRETGDISGATSPHAGAGGNFDNTGGAGTAPVE
jgi:hypothetical protein